MILESQPSVHILRLTSTDRTNRLTRTTIAALTRELERLCASRDAASRVSTRQADGRTNNGDVASYVSAPYLPLIITGNAHFFSAGADLNEIAALNGPEAMAFARAGQRLMQLIDDYPALTIAAVSGYCMGGGLDLALACDVRIAAPNAIFGHRGATLGLITGWGGTQRLPRLVGRGRALQMFCAAEKLHANEALAIGLVNAIADDPMVEALALIEQVKGQKAKGKLDTK